jgi:hypothetical protein
MSYHTIMYILIATIIPGCSERATKDEPHNQDQIAESQKQQEIQDQSDTPEFIKPTRQVIMVATSSSRQLENPWLVIWSDGTVRSSMPDSYYAPVVYESGMDDLWFEIDLSETDSFTARLAELAQAVYNQSGNWNMFPPDSRYSEIILCPNYDINIRWGHHAINNYDELDGLLAYLYEWVDIRKKTPSTLAISGDEINGLMSKLATQNLNDLCQ